MKDIVFVLYFFFMPRNVACSCILRVSGLDLISST